MASTPSRSALRKGARWTARIAGGAVRAGASCSSCRGALLVVGLPWEPALRRARAPQRDLPRSHVVFKGKIVVDHIGKLDGASGVGGVDAHMPTRPTEHACSSPGVRAHAHRFPSPLLESFLRTSHDLDLDVFAVNVDSVEVNVDTDNAGALKLVGAFDPAQPTTPPPPGRPPARGLHLEFPHATVGHTWVHGHMKGAPPVDADLDKLVAAVDVPAKGMVLDLSATALLVTRGMPQGANVLASLKAHFAMPSATGADMGVTGTFDGTIGGIPMTAQGALDGDRLDAVLDVPEFAAERLKALVPQAPVEKAGRGARRGVRTVHSRP